MRALIAEDDSANGRIVQSMLRAAGYETEWVRDGAAALAQLKSAPYDVLIVDWMMPELDGIEVIRRARAECEPTPFIAMLTALGDDAARQHAMTSGADDFLVKPASQSNLLQVLTDGLGRKLGTAAGLQVAPSVPLLRTTAADAPGIVVAASTGGPPVLTDLAAAGAFPSRSYVFVIVHGPAWMHESLATQLARVADRPVRVPEDGERAEKGTIYLAGRNAHLLVGPDLALRLDEGSPEHFTRPAADPTFRTVAGVFGRAAIGVVLTGIGRDGAEGAMAVTAAGGRVLVQEPESAVAQSMPQAAAQAVGRTALACTPSAMGATLDRLARLAQQALPLAP